MANHALLTREHILSTTTAQAYILHSIKHWNLFCDSNRNTFYHSFNNHCTGTHSINLSTTTAQEHILSLYQQPLHRNTSYHSINNNCTRTHSMRLRKTFCEKQEHILSDTGTHSIHVYCRRRPLCKAPAASWRCACLCPGAAHIYVLYSSVSCFLVHIHIC
jgi:hypothetical protein